MAIRKVNEKLRDEITQRVMNGESVYKLADKYQLSNVTIYRLLRESGFEKPVEVKKPYVFQISEQEIQKLNSNRSIMFGYNN